MAEEEAPPDDGNARPRKMPRVDQNHEVTITHINDATQDHFCTVEFFPDHKNPHGFIKQGIRLNVNEFSKGAKILGGRCGYRVLTPLSTHSYSAYLDKRAQEFLRHGDRGGATKPVVQVYNQNPFKYSKKYYVATNSKEYGIQVFELCSPTPKYPKEKENPVTASPKTNGQEVLGSTKIPETADKEADHSASNSSKDGSNPSKATNNSSKNAGNSSRDSDNLGEGLDDDFTGFARWIPLADLPFILNWTGPLFKSMVIDDIAVQKALVSIIDGLDEIHHMKGLGFCVLSEFGRMHMYNCLVDSDEGVDEEEEEDEGDDAVPDFRGYKQMLLILQSSENETGKSTLAEIFVRIFRRRKTGIYSSVSFKDARKEFGNGEPITIDDYCNDEVGRVLLTRGSKALWGKATILMQNETTIPLASLVICANENIKDLKVEGVNKLETYRKLSVIDLGETPIGRSEEKDEQFKNFVVQANIINKHFPSYCGLMLRNCGRYITPAEFSKFKDITNHERMANVLNNAVRLHSTLGDFCDQEKVKKPKSLKEPPNLGCLFNKSELVQKVKHPDQVVRFLIERKENIITTTTKNPDKEIGIAFAKSAVKGYPWAKQSFSMVHNDGTKIYVQGRTRRLDKDSTYAIPAYFLKIDAISESCQDEILKYLGLGQFASDEESENEGEGDEEEKLSKTPEEKVRDFFKKQAKIITESRISDFGLAKKYILSLVPKEFRCQLCDKKCKSKQGVTQHLRACPKKAGNDNKTKAGGAIKKKAGGGKVVNTQKKK